MLSPSEQTAIVANITADPRNVALQLKATTDLRPQVVATQVDCRQRLRTKVPTWYSVSELYVPSALNTQQCSSEGLARWRSRQVYGTSLLDLTGGLGVDCYFMSQRAERATYVEANKQLFEAVSWNYRHMTGTGHIEMLNTTAEAFLEGNSGHYDTLFLDPSRRTTTGSRVYKISDCQPNVSELAQRLIEMADVVLVKLSSLLDISSVIRDLPQATDVYVVGTNGECKDIIVRMSNEAKEEVMLHAVIVDSVTGDECHHICFTLREEQSAEAKYCDNLAEYSYLYEPDPALMKAGCYKVLSGRYELRAVSPLSHLYLSQEMIDDFPGRSFRIRQIVDFNKAGIKAVQQLTSSASVCVRNFPLRAEELRDRLKVKENRDTFIFGTTDREQKKRLIIADRCV